MEPLLAWPFYYVRWEFVCGLETYWNLSGARLAPVLLPELGRVSALTIRLTPAASSSTAGT